MASGSRGRGQGSAVAGADALALDTLANPDLANLPAVDLVVHLHREDRSGSDFADVALVLAARERRLTQAEARIREADESAAALRDTIRELKERVANAEALARDRTVAGEDDKPQAGDPLTAAIDVGAAELTGGEIRARGLEIVVAEPELEAGEITAGGVCFDAGVEATPAEVDDNIPSPVPLMRIDAIPVPVTVTAAPTRPEELIEERAVEGVVADVAVPRSQAGVVDCQDKVSEAIADKRKKPASDLSLPSDDLRSGTEGSSRARAAAEAPSPLLAPQPQLNPTILDAMPAVELVQHLNRYRRTADFISVMLVFADRERRLAENEGRVRECSERINSLLDEIRARENSAQEAEAQIRRAAETEKELRARIRTLQLSTATLISAISETGIPQQAAGHGREPVPQDFITASNDGVGFADATGVQTMIAQGGLVAALRMGHGEPSSAVPPHLVVVAPLPDTVIDGDERATEQVVPSSNEEAQGDHEVSEDVLRASLTAGHDKVSEEVAQEEDVAASLYRLSKGKEPERATRNAPKHKGALQLGAATLIPSGISRCSLTQQAAGHGREPVPQEDFIKAMFAPRLWSRSAPHFVAAPQMPLSRVAPHLFATPLPCTLIDDDKRAAEQVTPKVLTSNDQAQGDREVSEDVLRERVTPCCRRKVSEEEAQGEDVAASRHRSSQGEQAARASKKARKHKGTFLNDKQELLQKREEERLAKEAAAAASKQAEEDSGDGSKID